MIHGLRNRLVRPLAVRRAVVECLLQVPIKLGAFDSAILISVPEHTGLGSYGDNRATSDLRLLQAVARMSSAAGPSG